MHHKCVNYFIVYYMYMHIHDKRMSLLIFLYLAPTF